MTRHGILFVGNFLSSSGSNPTYSEDLTRRLENRAWPVYRTSSRQQRLLRAAEMVWNTWQHRRDYELAHIDVFSGAAFLWAEAVALELRALGKPYVLTLRGGNLPVFAHRWPRRVAALFSSARGITTPSSFLKNALGKLGSDVVVVPNAIDVSAYPYEGSRAVAPRLVWLRAFHRLYNPMLAVDVLAALDGDATLTMIGVDKGDGSLEATRARARELCVEHRITLVPGIPKHQVGRYLSEANVFLNTTTVDNTPVSVLEAMACGLCVISTNVGGLPYLLDDERTALLVPSNDAIAMTRAVERVLDDPELARTLSSNARDQALTFDWSRVIPEWEQLFVGAVGHA